MTNKIRDLHNPLSVELRFTGNFYLKLPPGRTHDASLYSKMCADIANACRDKFGLNFILREDTGARLSVVWETSDSYDKPMRDHNLFNLRFPVDLESLFYTHERMPKLVNDIKKPPEKLDYLNFSIEMFLNQEAPKGYTFFTIVVAGFNPTAFTTDKDTVVISTISTIKNGKISQSFRRQFLIEDNLAKYLADLRKKSAFWQEVKTVSSPISAPFGGQPES